MIFCTPNNRLLMVKLTLFCTPNNRLLMVKLTLFSIISGKMGEGGNFIFIFPNKEIYDMLVDNYDEMVSKKDEIKKSKEMFN